MKLVKKFQWLSLLLILSILTACAGASQVLTNRAYHSLSFRPGTESVGIDLLVYRYGSANQFGLRTPSEDAAEGKISSGAAITGLLPVGDDFYAKWRDKNTGQIYEDTVDLKSRLPFSMDRQRLKPIIEGSQLYIYVISYDPVREVMSLADVDQIRRTHKTPRERVFSFALRNRVIQIYPTRLEDPHLPVSLRK